MLLWLLLINFINMICIVGLGFNFLKCLFSCIVGGYGIGRVIQAEARRYFLFGGVFILFVLLLLWIVEDISAVFDAESLIFDFFSFIL